MIFCFLNIWFFWSHETYKRDVVRQNGVSNTKTQFYKERFARRLYRFRFKIYGPLCDFHRFFHSHVTLTRDVVRQTEGLWQKRNSIRNALQPTSSLCHFRFKKLWPIIWLSQKWWPWPWLSSYLKDKNKFGWSLNQNTSAVTKTRTIGPVVWPVYREQIDRQANRQTDKQTDRGDQYTFGDFAK